MKKDHMAVEALRRLCALLAPATRDTLGAAWPEPDLWPAIVSQADAHRLLPTLATTVRRSGHYDALDPELADIFGAVADWNTERNGRLRHQMQRVSAAFNEAGIRPVWLKGALALLPEDGPASGRFMLDLDVWVPDPTLHPTARETLVRLGYSCDSGKEAHYAQLQHYPPYSHPEEMALVELHRGMVPRRHEVLIPPEEAAARVEWMEWEGVRIGRLDPLSRALCALAQCLRPGDMRSTREVPLSKAHAFVACIHADFGGIIPPALLERVGRAGWEADIRPVLTLTECYFGIPNPLPADARLVRGLERATRTPRWNAVMAVAESILSARGLRLLREPARIPRALANHLARLRDPRPYRPWE